MEEKNKIPMIERPLIDRVPLIIEGVISSHRIPAIYNEPPPLNAMSPRELADEACTLTNLPLTFASYNSYSGSSDISFRPALKCPQTPKHAKGTTILYVNRFVLVALALLIVVVHCAFMYNTVGFIRYWNTDEELREQNIQNPGLFVRSTGYYTIADMFIGSGLTMLVDLIGPRWLMIMGHGFLLIGWSAYLLPMSQAIYWLPISAFLQGSAIQAICNPCILLGRLFQRHQPMVVGLIGGSIELSMAMPLIFYAVHSYLTIQQVATIMVILVVITTLMTFLIFPDEFPDDPNQIQEEDMSYEVESNFREDLQLPEDTEDNCLRNYTFGVNLEEESPEASFKELVMSSHYLYYAVFFIIIVTVANLQTNLVSYSIDTANAPEDALVFAALGPFGAPTAYLMGFIGTRYGVDATLHLFSLMGLIVSIGYYFNTKISMLIGVAFFYLYKTCLYTMMFAYAMKNFPVFCVARSFSLPPMLASVIFLGALKFIDYYMNDLIQKDLSALQAESIIMPRVWLFCIVVGTIAEYVFITGLQERPVWKAGRSMSCSISRASRRASRAMSVDCHKFRDISIGVVL